VLQHVAAAVAMQQATASGSGRALQQLLPSVSSSIRYWWGFCRVLPAGSNHFKKSTAVTATAMLPTFINQKQKSYDNNQSVGKGSRDRQKNGLAATVSWHVEFLHLLLWHCICCNAASYSIIKWWVLLAVSDLSNKQSMAVTAVAIMLTAVFTNKNL